MDLQTSHHNTNSSSNSLARSKQELIRQQQHIQLAAYLAGEIDEIEYRNRMASLGKFQQMDVDDENTKNVNISIINRNSKHLFGLEFFDPQQNMSDVRDASIENLFGLFSNSQRIEREKKRQASETFNESEFYIFNFLLFFSFLCGLSKKVKRPGFHI